MVSFVGHEVDSSRIQAAFVCDNKCEQTALRDDSLFVHEMDGMRGYLLEALGLDVAVERRVESAEEWSEASTSSAAGWVLHLPWSSSSSGGSSSSSGGSSSSSGGSSSSSRQGEADGRQRRISIEVVHVAQHFSWDCGLACVLMVLKTLSRMHGNGADDKNKNECKDGSGTKGLTRSPTDLTELHLMAGTRSVWTIDLAFLLRRFGASVLFCTVTLGANPGFCVESFYKENIDSDVVRVNSMFQTAGQCGIKIQQRSVTARELAAAALSGAFLIIILVDKREITHPGSTRKCQVDCCGEHPGYIGHYIVISGFLPDTDEFVIHDPSRHSDSIRVPVGSMEVARHAFGTDEDILFIPTGVVQDA